MAAPERSAATAVLQVGSCFLSFAPPGEREWRHSPCYASLRRGKWRAGDADRFQFHTEESSGDSDNTYFAECRDKKLHQRPSDAQSALDLVYLHLRDFLKRPPEDGEALLALVSAAYEKEQLRHLLGVLQALAHPPLALLQTPLAYSALLPQGDYAMLEVGLRQAVLTRLEIADGAARLRDSFRCAGLGLPQLCEQWFRIIDAEFLKRRYNARHDSRNKPPLFRQIVAQLRRDSSELRLELDGIEIAVARERLEAPLPEGARQWLAGRQCVLLPSPGISLRRVFPQTEALPLLDRGRLEALLRSEPLRGLSAAAAPEPGGAVRQYREIQHPQAPPRAQ